MVEARWSASARDSGCWAQLGVNRAATRAQRTLTFATIRQGAELLGALNFGVIIENGIESIYPNEAGLGHRLGVAHPPSHLILQLVATGFCGTVAAADATLAAGVA